MADGASPDRSGAEAPGESSVPAMPVIRPSERSANPYPVVEGLNRGIGWHLRSDRRGGPVFVLMSRPTVGFQKVLQRFPLTEAGWTRLGETLVPGNTDVAVKVRKPVAGKWR